MIQQLTGLYRQGQEKLRQGEWGEYGRIQEEIESIITRLEQGVSGFQPVNDRTEE